MGFQTQCSVVPTNVSYTYLTTKQRTVLGKTVLTELGLRQCWHGYALNYTHSLKKYNHSKAIMFSGVYLYSALPPIVARLEKTLKSVMLSGQDWMFRKPKMGQTHTHTQAQRF